MKTEFKKIVIGIDFTDASLAGARWVSTHLAPRAELLLVHVALLNRACPTRKCLFSISQSWSVPASR